MSCWDTAFWCYFMAEWIKKNSTIFKRNMKNKVAFSNGLDERIDKYMHDNFKNGLQRNNIGWFLMHKENDYVNNWFTSEHHPTFLKRKSLTNRLNTHYFIVLNFPDKSELSALARQLAPLKYKMIIETY